MKSAQSLSASKRHRRIAGGLLAMAAAFTATAGAANDTYQWSAEIVKVDPPARTVTVESRLVSNAAVDFTHLDQGDRVTLTWSGIDTAAGVRRIAEGPPPAEDRLTLPAEFVSAQHDNRYVRFKVPVPDDDVMKIAALEPGSWITATSPRRAAHFEEAVADMRPYNDVG
jgi:hypothetical protein